MHWGLLSGQFALVLQKALEVIKQASLNEDAIVRLHNHAVDISEGLLPYLRGLSSTPAGFDYALNKLMDLLKDISSFDSDQNSLVTKVMSATNTNLADKVDDYIKNLTDRKDRLMNLITIDIYRIVADNAEAKSYSTDDFLHSVPFKEGNSRSPVNRDVEESLTDEKAISKNAQESKYSNK